MLFEPPRPLTTEIFVRIPDHYRVRGRSNAWIDIQRGGAATDSFIEGPSFDRDGNLFMVDVAWGRLFKVTPSGDVSLFYEYDGEPNGLKIHRDGRFFIADYRHGILVLDPATGQLSTVVERHLLDRFKGVNDLVFASNGDLYFTDQGLTGLHDPTGSLYRLSADGQQLDRLVGNLPSPNGLALDAAERTVYVNVTRANAVWRVPLSAQGVPFKVGNFIQLSGGLGGPDGLAMDEEGGLAVAHVGLGTVWLCSRLGEPLYRVQSCAGLGTTNVAYGGPQRRHLYITESDTGVILRAEVPVAGRPMYSHH